MIEIRDGRGDNRPAAPGAAWRALEAAARESGVPIFSEPPDRGARSGARVTARAEPYPEESFESLLASSTRHLLVALDGVTDVGNLGSIARSAEVAGATGLVLEHRRAPPIHAGALRASAGALEHLRVARTPHLGRALGLAAREGVSVLAADVGGIPFSEILDREAMLRGGLIWVLGSEDRGLRPGVLERARTRVAVPAAGRVESLGVAAVAAFLLLRTAEVRRGEGA